MARAAPPLRPSSAAASFFSGRSTNSSSTSPVAICATRMALPITSAGRRWPLGPVGMDGLELLSVEGSAFAILDLDVANPALLPLSGDANDVQDIGNTRSVGGLPGNACEHVRRTLMH